MAENNQRVRLTKTLLKNSLIELLEKKDIFALTVHELCAKAGINRSTFYKYYENQFDLLLEIENEMLRQINNNLTIPINNDDKNSIANLANILAYLQANSRFAKVLINNNVDSGFPNKLMSLPLVQDNLRKEFNKRHSKEQSEYLLSFIINGGYSMVRDWLNKNANIPTDMMAKLIVETFNKIIC